MSLFDVRRTFFSTLLALAVIPLAAAGLAAQTGALTGKVTDALDGKPLGDATVEVIAAGARFSGLSGADGNYRVNNIPAGTVSVTVRKVAFQAQTYNGQAITNGGTTTLNVALTARVTMLGATAVTATRDQPQKVQTAPAQISVVSSVAIEERPAVTVTDNLRGVPGLDINKGGVAQSNIVARGFNNAFSGAMLMLQDYRFAGVPSLRVNVPLLFTGTNEDIDRIEVLLGPASALYGPNSANGVLHVITKSPFSSQGTTVSVDGGERSVLRVGARHAFQVNDKLAFKLSGENMRGRDWEYKDLQEPDTFPTAAPAGRRGKKNQRDFDIERLSGEARMDVRPNDHSELTSTFGYTKIGSGIELTGANGSSQIKNWTYMNFQQRLRYKRFFAQAFMNSNNAGNKDSLDLTGTFLLKSGQPIVDKSRVWALQAQHGLDLGTKQTFTYGVDYIATNPNTGGTINGRNENDDNATEYGAYLQSSTRPTEKFEVLTSLRYDATSVIEGSAWSPRAALLYKPSVNHNFRATYNRAFSTPANFSFFLDLVSSRASGANPYDVYAEGNPPKVGYQFKRDCTTTGNYSGICMRSAFTSNTGFQAATAGAAIPGVWTALGPALTPAVQAGVAQALSAPVSAGGLGLPAATAAAFAAQLAPAMINQIKGRIPTETELPTGLFLSSGLLANGAALTDVQPLKASFNNTYEVGYKGNLAEGKLQVDMSIWRQEKGDVGTSAALATPLVRPLTTAAYVSYVAGQWAQVIQAAAAANGLTVSAAQAAGLANALATPVVGQVAALPLGVVTWDGSSVGNKRLYATYQTLSKKKIWLTGMDLAMQVQASPTLTFLGAYSYMNHIVFPGFNGGAGVALMSNSASSRGSVTGRYDNDVSGWGVEGRLRYSEGYPVNSGNYGTDASYAIGAGNTGYSASASPDPTPGCPTTVAGRFCYGKVPEYVNIDAGVSKRFAIGAQRLQWSINVTNVFDNKVASFPGVPEIGRMAMTRLQYKF